MKLQSLYIVTYKETGGVMFFFWGPFFFVFPALIFFYVARRLFGSNRHREYDRFLEDPDFDSSFPARESTRVRIYKLAFKLGGRLTVSDIVIETGMEVEEAEKLIQSMVDQQRIRMEVTDEGLVVYEFPEILARYKDREKGTGGDQSDPG
jgi:hypothetical protein